MQNVDSEEHSLKNSEGFYVDTWFYKIIENSDF